MHCPSQQTRAVPQTGSQPPAPPRPAVPAPAAPAPPTPAPPTPAPPTPAPPTPAPPTPAPLAPAPLAPAPLAPAPPIPAPAAPTPAEPALDEEPPQPAATQPSRLPTHPSAAANRRPVFMEKLRAKASVRGRPAVDCFNTLLPRHQSKASAVPRRTTASCGCHWSRAPESLRALGFVLAPVPVRRGSTQAACPAVSAQNGNSYQKPLRTGARERLRGSQNPALNLVRAR